MSNQTGIDYDTLISRIHGGVCAFQSLRSHRRERTRDDSSPPPRASASSASPPRPAAAPNHVASDDGPPVFEPQAFIAHGGRVLPFFGDVRAVFHGAPPPAEASQPPPPPPRMPEELPLLVQDPPSSRPASASTLKLPLPTPPSRLGLVGRPTEAPAPTPEPNAPPAPRPAPATDGASTTTPQHATPSEPGLEALLASRAQAEAARLEQVHAEHRACLAMLLHEHRAELHAQAETDAARATQLVRELLAEHRAELTRTADAQVGRLALVLSQHREEMAAARTEQPEAASAPQIEALSTALIEQAKLQREAHEDNAQHIAAVTTLVADLGQTVSLLAVAVYDARQVRVPTVSLPPPPRVGGTVGSVVTAAMTTLGVSSASSSPVPAASSPAPATASVGRTPDAANASASGLVPACHAVPNPVDADRPSAGTPTRASPAAEDALACARLATALDDDDDDDDLAGVVDPEEHAGRARLGPVTDLVLGEAGAADV